jgi:hypothetical protein
MLFIIYKLHPDCKLQAFIKFTHRSYYYYIGYYTLFISYMFNT